MTYNKSIKELSDLTDSHLLYERKLPAFGYLIVLIVVGILISVLIWSLITPKVYIVKGNGIIESGNKNYIMSSYSGEIVDIKIGNGDYVEKDDLLFTVKSTDLHLQQIQIDGKIEIFEKQISGLQKLEESIKNNQNFFDTSNLDDRQYYYQYEAYEAQIAQNSIDVSAYEQYGYTDAQIEAEIQKNEGKISEIYNTTLNSIRESIDSAGAEIESLKIQSEAIAEGQSDYRITAPTNGIVYLNIDYKQGMVVQAGNAIGSIANENDTYIVKTYINVNDMPRVNIGDNVDVAISGLMESVYGTVPGQLVNIDSDITTQQSINEDNAENKGSYYRLDVELGVNYLISNSGRQYVLKNGTAVETRIKYDEINYFGYLLESLGILVR